MKPIDMTPYRPYKTMGKSCELREIREKKIVWPFIDHVDTDPAPTLRPNTWRASKPT